MLLRRIIEHAKVQNWTAVVLDFFIVVVGVFIGIQVSNWNDDRAEGQREKVLLERLHTDFERIVQWGDEYVPAAIEVPSHTSRLIESIRADIEPIMDEEFRLSAMASVNVLAPFELSATYEELVATGTLSRITKPEIRDALATYRRARETDRLLVNQQLDIQNSGTMEQAIRFRTHGENYGEVLVPVSFDWQALKQTEPQLQVVLRNQLLSRIWKQITLQSARDVVTLIRAELYIGEAEAVDETPR